MWSPRNHCSESYPTLSAEQARALAEQILRDVPAPAKIGDESDAPAPSAPSRPETGPMRFGTKADEWTGLYLRHDAAMGYVEALRLSASIVARDVSASTTYAPRELARQLRELADLIDMCAQHDDRPVTELRPFAECLPPEGSR